MADTGYKFFNKKCGSRYELFELLDGYLSLDTQQKISFLSGFSDEISEVPHIDTIISLPPESELDGFTDFYSRQGNTSHLKKYYDKVLSDAEISEKDRALAYFFRGLQELATGALRDAYVLLKKPLSEISSEEYPVYILFQVFWLEIRQRNFIEASVLIDSLVKRSENSSFSGVLLYLKSWLDIITGGSTETSLRNACEKSPSLEYYLGLLHTMGENRPSEIRKILTDIIPQLEDSSGEYFCRLQKAGYGFMLGQYSEILDEISEMNNPPEDLQFLARELSLFVSRYSADSSLLLKHLAVHLKDEPDSELMDALLLEYDALRNDADNSDYGISELRELAVDKSESVIVNSLLMRKAFQERKYVKGIQSVDLFSTPLAMMSSGEIPENIDDVYREYPEVSILASEMSRNGIHLNKFGKKESAFLEYVEKLYEIQALGWNGISYTPDYTESEIESVYLSWWMHILNKSIDAPYSAIMDTLDDDRERALVLETTMKMLVSVGRYTEAASLFVSTMSKCELDREELFLGACICTLSKFEPADEVWMNLLESNGGTEQQPFIAAFTIRKLLQNGKLTEAGMLCENFSHFELIHKIKLEYKRVYESDEESIVSILDEFQSNETDAVEKVLRDPDSYYLLDSLESGVSRWFQSVLAPVSLGFSEYKSRTYENSRYFHHNQFLMGTVNALRYLFQNVEYIPEGFVEWCQDIYDSSPDYSVARSLLWLSGFLTGNQEKIKSPSFCDWQKAEILLHRYFENPEFYSSENPFSDDEYHRLILNAVRLRAIEKENYSLWVRCLDISTTGIDLSTEYRAFTGMFGNSVSLSHESELLYSILYPHRMSSLWAQALTGDERNPLIDGVELRAIELELSGNLQQAWDFRRQNMKLITPEGAFFVERLNEYISSPSLEYLGSAIQCDTLSNNDEPRKEHLYKTANMAFESGDHYTSLKAFWYIYADFKDEISALIGAINVSLYMNNEAVTSWLIEILKKSESEEGLTLLKDLLPPETIAYMSENPPTEPPFSFFSEHEPLTTNINVLIPPLGIAMDITEKLISECNRALENSHVPKTYVLTMLLAAGEYEKVSTLIGGCDGDSDIVTRLLSLSCGLHLGSDVLCDDAFTLKPHDQTAAFRTLSVFWKLVTGRASQLSEELSEGVFLTDWYAAVSEHSKLCNQLISEDSAGDCYLAYFYSEYTNCNAAAIFESVDFGRFTINYKHHIFRKNRQWSELDNISADDSISLGIRFTDDGEFSGDSDDFCTLWLDAFSGRGKFSKISTDSDELNSLIHLMDSIRGNTDSLPQVPDSRDLYPFVDLAARMQQQRSDTETRRKLQLIRSACDSTGLLKWMNNISGDEETFDDDYSFLFILDDFLKDASALRSMDISTGVDFIPHDLYGVLESISAISKSFDNMDVSEATIGEHHFRNPADIISFTEKNPSLGDSCDVLTQIVFPGSSGNGSAPFIRWFFSSDDNSLLEYCGNSDSEHGYLGALFGMWRNELMRRDPSMYYQFIPEKTVEISRFRQALRGGKSEEILSADTTYVRGEFADIMFYSASISLGRFMDIPDVLRRNSRILRDDLFRNQKIERVIDYLRKEKSPLSLHFSRWLDSFVLSLPDDATERKYSGEEYSFEMIFSSSSSSLLKKHLEKAIARIQSDKNRQSFRKEMERIKFRDKKAWPNTEVPFPDLKKDFFTGIFAFLSTTPPLNSGVLLEYLQENPDFSRWHNQFAAEYSVAKKTDTTDDLSDVLLPLGKHHASSLYSLCCHLCRNKKLTELTEILAGRVSGKYPESWFNDRYDAETVKHIYGILLLKSGDYKTAGEIFTSLIRQNPSDETAFKRAMYSMKKCDEDTVEIMEYRFPGETDEYHRRILEWNIAVSHGKKGDGLKFIEVITSSDLEKISSQAALLNSMIKVVCGLKSDMNTVDALRYPVEVSMLLYLSALNPVDTGIEKSPAVDEILDKALKVWSENIFALRLSGEKSGSSNPEKAIKCFDKALKIEYNKFFTTEVLKNAALTSENYLKDMHLARRYYIAMLDINPEDAQLIQSFIDFTRRDHDEVFLRLHLKSMLGKYHSDDLKVGKSLLEATELVLKTLHMDDSLEYLKNLENTLTNSSPPVFSGFDFRALTTGEFPGMLYPAKDSQGFYSVLKYFPQLSYLTPEIIEEIPLSQIIRNTTGLDCTLFSSKTDRFVITGHDAFTVYVPSYLYSQLTPHALSGAVAGHLFVHILGFDRFDGMSDEEISGLFSAVLGLLFPESDASEGGSASPSMQLTASRALETGGSHLKTVLAETLSNWRIHAGGINKVRQCMVNRIGFLVCTEVVDRRESVIKDVYNMILDERFHNFLKSSRMYRLVVNN
ncbi:MAG: hypothetical protein JXR95_04610 [Deltaproteobacteria bacterium]|nr:hypothetical protein [Deltaproteobacteria bacterium]